MECPFTPARGKIVCQKGRLVPKSRGILHIPEKKTSLYMLVVAVGPGRFDVNGKEMKPLVKKGDIVTIGSAQPQPLLFLPAPQPPDVFLRRHHPFLPLLGACSRDDDKLPPVPTPAYP